MTLITPNKTVGTTLLPWQDVATGSIIIGGVQDVSTKYAASFAIKIARRTGTAFTAGWPNIRIEASAKSSGNDAWIPIVQVQPALGSSIVNTTLNGAVSAAAATFVISSNTNLGAGDILFLGDGSQGNYELVRVKSFSGSAPNITVTPEENVSFAHANAAIVTDQAEMYDPACDLTPYARVRAVADNGNSGQAISVQVLMTTHDSHNA